jgi:hypothetical protein
MTAVKPLYQEGPVTFTASVAVTGGQLVDAIAGGTVGPSAAGSLVCVGVATTDAIPASASQVPTVPGAPVSINAAPLPAQVAVANEGVWKLTYLSAATFGSRVICAANGQVAAAGATPDARTVVGVCVEPNGVAAGALGATMLSIS